MSIGVVSTLVKAYWVGNKPIRTALERLSFVQGGSKKGKWVHVLMTLLLVLVIGYFLLFLGMNYYAYQTLGFILDLPHLGLFIACLVSFSSLFLLSFTSIASIVYESKDIAMLRSLYVQGSDLAISRLLILYAYYLPLHLFLFTPALVVALLSEGFSLAYLLGSLALLLCFPIFPLALSALLSMGFAMLAKNKRSSFVQQMIFMLLFFVLIILASTTMTRYMIDESLFSVDYQAMQASLGDLIHRLDSKLVLFSLAAKVPSKISYSVLFLLSSLLGALAIGFFTARTYDRLYFSLAEASSSRTAAHRMAKLRAKGPLVALMKRELVIIRSQSAFIFEVVGEMFIPLVLLVVYALTGVLDELSGVLVNIQSFAFLPELLFLVMLLMASLGMLSSTSVSRQGKMFVLDRLYPLDASIFVQAKLALHLLLFGVPNLLFLGICVIALRLSFFHLMWMGPLSLLSLSLIASLQLAIDYHHPNLGWVTAQQAMKSNLNGLFGLLVGLVCVMVIAVFLLLPYFFPIPHVLATALLVLFCPLSLFFSYRLAVQQASLALSR